LFVYQHTYTPVHHYVPFNHNPIIYLLTASFKTILVLFSFSLVTFSPWIGEGNGSDNQKAEWRRGLKARLDELVAKEILGELTPDEARNPAYADYDTETMVIFDPDKPLHRQFGVSASAATLRPGQRRATVYATPSSAGHGPLPAVEGINDISTLSAQIGITLPSTGGDSPCSSPVNIHPANGTGTKASSGLLSNNNINNKQNGISSSSIRDSSTNSSSNSNSSSRRPPLPKGNNNTPHHNPILTNQGNRNNQR
jgi:hypothetical protein